MGPSWSTVLFRSSNHTLSLPIFRLEIEPRQAARWLVTASALAQIVEESAPGDVLRYDGVYVATSDNQTSASCMRFFPDGTVLSVSVGETHPIEADWAPDWLTRDWAEWQKYSKGTYTIDQGRIAFSIPVPDGEITYDARLRGSAITARWRSSATNRSGERTHVFRPAKRADV